MAKAPSGESIDHLYQLPLDEFTAARNTLAKESGDATVKKLEKPSLAAWAVNQLYWRERKLFDEVIKTSTQVRTAYKQMLEGKTADVRAADTFHADAMRRAKDAIRRMLEEAGASASDAIMTPVTETLDAMPTTDPPGRLTRPLRRSGFEALAGVTITASRAAKPPAVHKAEKPAEHESDRERRKREADRQELAMARERLRFVEAAAREAEASLERARRALERAERTRERIQKEMDEAETIEAAARKDVRAGESALEKAQSERDRLAKKVSA